MFSEDSDHYVGEDGYDEEKGGEQPDGRGGQGVLVDPVGPVVHRYPGHYLGVVVCSTHQGRYTGRDPANIPCYSSGTGPQPGEHKES